MVKDGRKVVIGVGLVAGAAGILLLLKKEPSVLPAPPAPPAPPEPPPPPPELANIYGVVTFRKTGAPLSGVKISLDGIITYTNANGEYLISNQSPGTYTMTLEKEGYETRWDTVAIVEGNNEINAEMTLVPALMASLSGYITDIETGAAIVGATITVVEHTGFMEANVYKTTSDTNGFYSLPDMGFENSPVVVGISVKAGGYDLITLEDVFLAEGTNALNFDMVWRLETRDIPYYISHQLPNQIVSGEEFTASLSIWLPYYQQRKFKATITLRLPEDPKFNTSGEWGYLPDILYDQLGDKADWLRFDHEGGFTSEVIFKAVKYGIWNWSLGKGWWREETPLPPGTYELYVTVESSDTQILHGDKLSRSSYGFRYKSDPILVGTVEVK